MYIPFSNMKYHSNPFQADKCRITCTAISPLTWPFPNRVGIRLPSLARRIPSPPRSTALWCMKFVTSVCRLIVFKWLLSSESDMVTWEGSSTALLALAVPRCRRYANTVFTVPLGDFFSAITASMWCLASSRWWSREYRSSYDVTGPPAAPS